MSKGYSFKKYWFYDLHKILVLPVWFLIYRPKYLYISKEARKKIKGSAILTCNHNTFLDVIYLQMTAPYRRHHILSAEEIVESKKFINWMLTKLLAIKISRDQLSLASYKEIVKDLKNGKVIDIFAEGGINEEEGTISELKQGPVYIAYKTNTKIIPMYIKAPKNIFHRLRVAIGEEINLQELGFDSKDKIPEATEYLRLKEIELLNLVKQDK